jgi:hypothetical protein
VEPKAVVFWRNAITRTGGCWARPAAFSGACAVFLSALVSASLDLSASAAARRPSTRNIEIKRTSRSPGFRLMSDVFPN